MNSIFQEHKPLYDLSNFSILVVEDSMFMQNLIVSMLKAFGVGDIMIAESAREAIEILTVTQARAVSQYATKIDIILTDWLMNKGSGEDLLRWVRTHERDEVRFLPVIVVSGYTTDVVTNAARDMGAHELLTKPVSANGIASRICSVIDNPRPFISVPDYFGPDRRRKDEVFSDKDRRVMKTEDVVVLRK